MGLKNLTNRRFSKEEESKAETEIWKYIFGFTEMAVVKCAVEMGIPDVLETQEHPITLEELSTLLKCHSAPLHRIMRFLIFRGIFKKEIQGGRICYTQTPLSRLLIKEGEKSMAAFLLLESSHVMLAPWHELSSRVLMNGAPAFEGAHGEDIWKYAEKNSTHSKLINDAMACDARLSVPAIIEHCPEVFEGVRTLVDVGGGNGTTLSVLVKAFPWIHGINFDLPHVVSTAQKCDHVESIAGDMFKTIPKADAIFIKWVLHDWSDEECIKILKNCREAIPKENGKVIIAEAVIDSDEEEEENKELADVGLMLDMVMMAHTTKGKERTSDEWTSILKAAGFNIIDFKNIQAVQSVILGYP